MDEAFFTLAGAFGPAGVAVALVVLGLLSQRLGAVTKTPPYYRWFYVAAGLVGVSLISRILSIGAHDVGIEMVYTFSFALGVTIGLVVAWRYWNWLFGERGN
ncbi:MAG: hypothetical protein Kow0077_02820 [Anaerolineae bacterium]